MSLMKQVAEVAVLAPREKNSKIAKKPGVIPDFFCVI